MTDEHLEGYREMVEHWAAAFPDKFERLRAKNEFLRDMCRAAISVAITLYREADFRATETEAEKNVFKMLLEVLRKRKTWNKKVRAVVNQMERSK